MAVATSLLPASPPPPSLGAGGLDRVPSQRPERPVLASSRGKRHTSARRSGRVGTCSRRASAEALPYPATAMP